MAIDEIVGKRYYLVFGVWRSPVAHLVWDQGVQGSNPCTPTKFVEKNPRVSTLGFFFSSVAHGVAVCSKKGAVGPFHLCGALHRNDDDVTGAVVGASYLAWMSQSASFLRPSGNRHH